jgi:hypothetical protein
MICCFAVIVWELLEAWCHDSADHLAWEFQVRTKGIVRSCRVKHAIDRWKSTDVSHECFAVIYLVRSGSLFRLFFESGDGGDMFLQNVNWLSADYTVLYPRSSVDGKNAYLRGCYAVLFDRWIGTFFSNLLPPLSDWEIDGAGTS